MDRFYGGGMNGLRGERTPLINKKVVYRVWGEMMSSGILNLEMQYRLHLYLEVLYREELMSADQSSKTHELFRVTELLQLQIQITKTMKYTHWPVLLKTLYSNFRLRVLS
ncbi:uncharacterized protein LOC110904224 [Helianthus annuus]|uniref:uncharacterized protein LOC110904224 n=1 Tax=Helianthus annuus TaxID=4232 RepID=UPI000B8F914F|nr:uncharacterized protein LOC110904224 [Helianthus annuus]